MKKWLSTLVNSIISGEFIGLVISLSYNYLSGTYHYYPSGPVFLGQFDRPLDAVLTSVILWGLMGLVFGLGSFIFAIRNWSLTKRTVVNFLIYYIGFTPLALLAGWFPLTWGNFFGFTIIFTIIYALIWLISYFIGRNNDDKVME